jgi:hypothetical protein
VTKPTHIVAAAGMLGIATSAAWASDHHDAPLVFEFLPGDISDLYVFRSPERQHKLVLVLTVNPAAVPAFAEAYVFSQELLYRLAVDSDGDAVADREISFAFTPIADGPQTVTITLPDGTVIEGEATAPTVEEDGPNPPVVIEDPWVPGVRAFAGPRDDPFFFDAVGYERMLNGGDFTGTNTFAGLNVSAIVIELPIGLLADGSQQLAFSAFTSYRPDEGAIEDTLDRVGNPFVLGALIPFDQRDAFNSGLPENDAADFEAVVLDTLADMGASSADAAELTSFAVPDTLKLDLRQEIGYPNGRLLTDDVIDRLLPLIFGAPTSDGVDANDKPFLDTFPYLAPPHQVP